MITTSSSGFSCIEETEQPFLALWPHRYDYLWAEHPHPDSKPHWQTESRHPLSDRLLLQGNYLYGVRFGQMTAYAMLDIDSGSPYHPNHNPQAVLDILGVLEEKLGCSNTVAIHSSWSGGLHVYIPFSQPLKTFTVATVISNLLEQAGYKIAGGVLEVFPNRKLFTTDGSLSLYNGHRLPLQAGSFLLNEDWQPIYSTKEKFIALWEQAAEANELTSKCLDRFAKQLRKPYRMTDKAAKFLNDLNAEIEQGWTGIGQTNRLLGRIAMRAYVFGQQLLSLAEPLSGAALVNVIIETAKSLPGFDSYCGHQDDLEQRARDWARSVENSHYYPYGSTSKNAIPETTNSLINTWNQQQQTQARERIMKAVATLSERQELPSGITGRFEALVSQGISGTTLYKYKDLWHPSYQQVEQEVVPQDLVEIPPDPPDSLNGAGEEGLSATSPANPTSLLGRDGCNTSSDKGPRRSAIRQATQEAVRAAQESYRQQREQHQHQRNLLNLQQHWQRMMDYLTSGDSILVREAEEWLHHKSYIEQIVESHEAPPLSAKSRADSQIRIRSVREETIALETEGAKTHANPRFAT